MKYHHFLIIPALGISVFSPAALAQDDELDITIRVMNENEQPAGFVRRLELPSPESLGIPAREESAIDAEIDNDVTATGADIIDTINASEEVVVNTVIDNISIDGASADATLDNAGNLPNQVVDILDDDLPLNDDLADAVDDTTGEIVDVTNDILGSDPVDVAAGIGGDTVDDITDDAVAVGEDVSGSVDDTAGDIVDAVGDATGDTVDDIEDPAADVEGTLDTVNDTGTLASDLDALNDSLDSDTTELPASLSDSL